jgi:hypothetical protein
LYKIISSSKLGFILEQEFSFTTITGINNDNVRLMTPIATETILTTTATSTQQK